MLLERPGKPLREVTKDIEEPSGTDLVIEVSACDICRTDRHIVDGEIISGRLPIVPGHEIVGRIVASGPAAQAFSIGERIGVPWLGGTDGSCSYCREGRENLCDRPTFTGFNRDGGYVTNVLAIPAFAFAFPRNSETSKLPLSCAPDSSAIAHSSSQEVPNVWASSASALPHITLPNSPLSRAAVPSHSQETAIFLVSNSHGILAATGPAVQRKTRPRSSTRRSSLHRPANSCSRH